MKNNDSQGEIKFLDHTADVGIEVIAEDKKQALELAALGLFKITTEVENLEAKEEIDIEVSPVEDDEQMLFDFLNELIYLMDFQKILFKRVEVIELNGKLRARAFGEIFDPQKHEIKESVKAATFHELFFGKEGNHWKARVIFDV